jgi:hypothetical protein
MLDMRTIFRTGVATKCKQSLLWFTCGIAAAHDGVDDLARQKCYRVVSSPFAMFHC